MLWELIWYGVFIIMIVIVLPFFIVRGCSFEEDKGVPETGQKPEGLKINVYVNSLDKVVEMPLEDYIKGVVAAEMPASFEMEALKAQAVASRTYAYGRLAKIYIPSNNLHEGADICTDPAHCQAWASKETAMKGWGIFNAGRYWKKIEKAVDETKDVILLYDGKVINPVFHSNSGGKTENAEDVWAGGSVPYLRSIVSNGEEDSSQYKHVTFLKIDEFCTILENQFPDIKLNKKDILKDIKIMDYTEGNRVKTIKIGNVELKGTEFRKIFSLKSANFKIEQEDKDTLKITTIGNGHGVGMSQWGANYLAKSGGTYEEILKYYYQGVELSVIK